MKNFLLLKTNPNRDWKIIAYIFIAGIILISLFAWKIYLSDELGGGYFGVSSPSAEIETLSINEKRLQADILLLESIKSNYLDSKTTQSKVIDPSN